MTYAFDPELAPWISMIPEITLTDPAAMREADDRLLDARPRYEPPVPVDVRDVAVPGPGGAPAVPVRIFTPAGAGGRLPGLLYIHGGGFVLGSVDAFHDDALCIAAEVGAVVLSVEYRLAPEHPFPAALEDAAAAYRWLLDRGVPASGIVVAGDSAGGHLAATLAGEICRTGLPSPAGIVLFSPWVDLTCELSTRAQRRARDPYISAYAARRVARLVVGSAGFDDPRLALLTCAWADTPPVLIQVGGVEVLRPEAEALADALTASGADCELQVWKGQMHVFQILNRVLPEASAAMRDAARFIGSVTAPAPKESEVAA